VPRGGRGPGNRTLLGSPFLTYVSVFEVLRSGPGPSSVQTMGPLIAARQFAHLLEADGVARAAARIDVELYGGLACGGRESATGAAIMAGLAGDAPEQSDATSMQARAAAIKQEGTLRLNGRQAVGFDADRDIAYRVDRSIEGASNALRFIARGARGDVIAERAYYSIGDGEIVDPSHVRHVRENPRVPYPFVSAAALVDAGEIVGKKLAAIGFANETAFRSPGDVRAALTGYGEVMRAAVQSGLGRDDPLPGGRTRRAPAQAIALRNTQGTPAQWCSVMAQAVAEENAGGGRVVAAPTSGSAGPVAALLMHWRQAKPLAEDTGTIEFLMTAGVVGALLRGMGLRQAGCQSVIGVASAMAAAGYAAVLGASNAQMLHAAELALAPHLGQACDPEGGRIQQPCIGRNAAAAAHAHASVQVALTRPDPGTGLDSVVSAMIESGRAMSGRYKEASLGAAAINVAEC
jgi:L-serine dehydratase